MCITREALVKFYGSLSFSLRTLIHYRVLAATGRPFDYFLVEEPWSIYGVLERAMGVHNAELFLYMLKHWLEKNGLGRLRLLRGGCGVMVKCFGPRPLKTKPLLGLTWLSSATSLEIGWSSGRRLLAMWRPFSTRL